jgi:hypothetical protein
MVSSNFTMIPQSLEPVITKNLEPYKFKVDF